MRDSARAVAKASGGWKPFGSATRPRAWQTVRPRRDRCVFVVASDAIRLLLGRMSGFTEFRTLETELTTASGRRSDCGFSGPWRFGPYSFESEEASTCPRFHPSRPRSKGRCWEGTLTGCGRVLGREDFVSNTVFHNGAIIKDGHAPIIITRPETILH
jgi:hypothetical protein